MEICHKSKNGRKKLTLEHKTYDMRGFEPETKPKDPALLSPNQSAVYESLNRLRSLQNLYIIHKDLMPESSVRRILYVLKYAGLVEKSGTKWRQVKH